METHGDVSGLTVRSRGLFANIGAAIKALFGGEVGCYTNMLEAAREQATARMLAEAEQFSANTVLSMRFDASQLSSFMAEVVAYDTAAVTTSSGQPNATQRLSLTRSEPTHTNAPARHDRTIREARFRMLSHTSVAAG